jgi:hypothetical protein
MNTHLFGTPGPVSVWTHLLAGAVCAVSLCGAAIADERQPEAAHRAGRQRFHAKIAGTCTNKDDFSFTGTTAGLFPGGALRVHCVVAGNSTHGRYTAQILAEQQVTANTCTQPGATGLEANVTAFVLVLSLNATQEQLFLTSKSGTQCLTPPGTVAGGTGKLDVIGGTGRFEGATGTLVGIVSPIALAFSALGGDGFLSAFSGTLDGRIVLK